MQMEVVGVPMSFLTLSVEMPEELYDINAANLYRKSQNTNKIIKDISLFTIYPWTFADVNHTSKLSMTVREKNLVS